MWEQEGVAFVGCVWTCKCGKESLNRSLASRRVVCQVQNPTHNKRKVNTFESEKVTMPTLSFKVSLSLMQL